MTTDTARRQYLDSMTEKQWQETVIEIAKYHGYRAMHHLVSKGTEPGWPDLVLAREARGGRPAEVLFVELKTETGKVTAAQGWWLAVLADSGHESVCWRPSQLKDVVARLSGST